MNGFDGKVVFITGASSGIGAALAREFAARGAHLALAARRADRLAALAAECERPNRRVVCLPCDVTRDDDLPAATAAARAALGPVDVAVANAGFGVGGRVDGLALDDFRRQFETNVFGVLRTVHATLDDLKQTRGRLVLVGSVGGYLSVPGFAAYGMSKAAVRALADSLRAELRPAGVSVTHVAPGFVASGFHQVDRHGVRHDDWAGRPSRLALPADRAARSIASAVARRKREAVFPLHGKVLAGVARHAPWLVPLAFRLKGAKG